jgi:endoribonuclease Dicer
VTAGREVALRVTKAMNIPVPHIDRWTDFARKTLAPPPDVSAQLKAGTVEHIETAIGRPFQRPHLLAQALVTFRTA